MEKKKEERPKKVNNKETRIEKRMNKNVSGRVMTEMDDRKLLRRKKNLKERIERKTIDWGEF